MAENEYKVAGYSFTDLQLYKEAKREEETVEYIRANTDLNDMNKTLKLYHKLVERKTLKSVVGIAFLKELQDRILKEGIISKENLPCIPIDKESKQFQIYNNPLEHELENKNQALTKEYHIKIRNSRIISLFLIIIIIVMFAISIFSNRNIFTNYENDTINKYASWEEELNAKEKALNDREAALNEQPAAPQE